MWHIAPILGEGKKEGIEPFDELILSWNGERPKGDYLFFIRVKIDSWSAWIPYAIWGYRGQSSFSNSSGAVKVEQDRLYMEEKRATAFHIKVVAKECSLEQIHALHIYTNGVSRKKIEQNPTRSVALQVPKLSQMALDHPRKKDLCSPTSTTALLSYLLEEEIDAALFAEQVWDAAFDIYGNWSLNVAAASTYLGERGGFWVERLPDFCSICSYLQNNIPVIVSVRGPLPGSASPYAEGHLLVVRGYDALRQQVLCMDPAFLTENYVAYDLASFCKAWGRRGNIAYVFQKHLGE